MESQNLMTKVSSQQATKRQVTYLSGAPGPSPSRKRKNILPLLSAEAQLQWGIQAKTARLVINAYPVFVLSNEWLEELFCEQCGSNIGAVSPNKPFPNQYTVRWAPQHPLEKVAHVDPCVANPNCEQIHPKPSPQTPTKRCGRKTLLLLIKMLVPISKPLDALFNRGRRLKAHPSF